MSSPRREAQRKTFSNPAVTQSKRGNRLDCSSDSSFHPVSPHSQLVSHEYLKPLPAFKNEPSSLHTFSIRTPFPPQSDLSVVKLPQLVSKVGVELVLEESVWNEGPCFVASALGADIPVNILKHSSIPPFNVDHKKPTPPQDKKKKRKCNLKPKPLTGTEVFEILTKKKHLGEHEFYYLKPSEDGPYRPYDLHVVPHSAVGRDYYTFSPTTVIHVQDGCSVELWTLAGWYKESLLWEDVRHVPFFRDYLLRKTFERWHRNVHIASVKHRTNSLPSQLLMAVPQFKDALLQLSRLIEEIKKVSWLPQDSSRTFSLLDFQTALLDKNQTAQLSLNSFLHYRATILNMAKDKSYQVHQELQMEVEHSKLYQSSHSLNLQLTNLRNLQKHLKRAEQALQRLGNLAALADCMTVQNLVTISKQEVTSFLNNVLKRDLKQQGALFHAETVFGTDGQLTVFPPLHLFHEVLHEALLSVPNAVLQVFDSCSLSCDSEVRSPSGSMFISDAQDLTAGTGRACTSRNTDTAAGAGSVFSQKERKMSPQTIVPVKMKSLRVQAQRVRGHYQPLPRRQLEWHLKVHTGTQEIQNEQARITQEAITEVNQLCEGHSWLTDVHLFMNQWDSKSLEALRGCSYTKYEEFIKKLHSWMERVHSMPSSFTTSNKLFTIKIFNILKEMGSTLSTIDKDVQKLLCEDLQSRSENLASELTEAVEVIKSEPNTFDSFTVFSKVVKHSVEVSDDLRKRLEDIHSLQETLQRNYTHMAPDGGFLMKQITDLWNQFVPLLKGATDVVFHQLPLMVNTLDSNFSSLVNELENLVSRASSEPYLDPDQNAKDMLIRLNALCSQFYVIAEKLNNQSRACETLREHPLDLTFVSEAKQKIEARRGLWELISVSSTQIQEWKLQKFTKFMVPKAQDKISEWLQQAEAFTRVIPSHDAVLQTTLQILHGFSQLIPILRKLSSLTLNNKNWRNISKEIGLLYDPEKKLTLGDLMSKELTENQYKINKIYVNAKGESKIEQIFRTLQRHWEGAVFRHTRFIIAVQQQRVHEKEMQRKSLQSPQEGDAKEKNTYQSSVSRLSAPKHHIKDGGTFTIVGLDSIFAQINQSVLSLSDILRSPHIADLQQEVENCLSLLQELDKLLEIFERFQDKWIFLSKTFNETSAITEHFELQDKFHPVDKVFQDIIGITVNDPHVLSFLQLKVTKEASPDIQGQSLYTLLTDGLTTMEEISSQFLFVLESARSQFPRLYFLSDGEVIKLLSLQLAAPFSLLPLVQKCFRGVRQLDVYDESDVNLESDLTAISNEPRLVRGIYGTFREHVPFLCHLESNLNPVAWLSLFEKKLHQAMKQMIFKCIDVQQHSTLEEHKDTSVLSGKYRRNNFEVAHEPPSILKLIFLYPLQCLLVAEEVLWCTMIQKSFQSPTAAILAAIKSRNTAKLHYLCQQLKVNHANSNNESQRIIKALRTLVMLTMKHSQQTDRLIEVKVDLDSSFEWHKLMKYYFSPSASLPPKKDSSCMSQSVYVDILCTQHPYGYEYISPEDWMMVTTPSTEKAYMGIILALSSYKCAFISGPNMSGKKHVVVQLGYALGRQVVCMKCYLTMGFSVLSQMLLGALQTGAWLVFDSVDSMKQGTLSELGHHLSEIQHLFSVQKSKLSQSESIKDQSNTKNEVECHIAGKTISGKLSYGCITIVAHGYSTEIPENLRVAIRPVAMVQPHYKMIAEVILVSLGFSEAATLSRRLVSLFSLAKDSHCLPDFVNSHQTSWLVLLKKVLAASGTHLHYNCRLRETNTSNSVSQVNAIINEETEELASIKGVLSVMQCSFSDSKRAFQFHTMFEEIFPKAKYFTGLQHFINVKELNILKNAVKENLQRRGFYADAQTLQNVFILFQALKLSNVVFLVGPAGSGKTTLYQALANALQKLSRSVKVESDDLKGDFTDLHHHSSTGCWTSVSTEVLFPNAFSHKEFFGGYCDQNNFWFDGTFTKALRQVEQPSAIPLSKGRPIKSMKWIVLDGDPQGKPAWLDYLSTLCNLENPHLCLSSGEKVKLLRGKVKILSEITDLDDSSPSIVTQCNVVYVSGENLWKAVWKCEMDVLSSKHNVEQITLKMWDHLAKDLFADTLIFLRKNTFYSVMASGKPSSRITDGMQEVMSFMNLLNALLEHFGKGGGLNCTTSQSKTSEFNPVFKPHCRDASASSIQWSVHTRNLFIVAYIWGFGGHLHPKHWPQFDLFAREALYKSHCKVETPSEGTVFENFFVFGEEMGDTTNFINCNMRKNSHLFNSVSQYEKHAYLLDMLLDAHQPTILVGESGSGKTMLCKSIISRGIPHMHIPAGPGLQHFDFHKSLRYQNSYLSNIKDAIKQRDFLLFIDDLHEAPLNVCAVLRQSISRGEMLTTDSTHFKLIQSKAIDYLSTCSAPHLGTHNHISPRLFRLFTLLALPSMTLEILFSMQSSNLQPWLKSLKPMQKVEDMANCIITSTVDVYFAMLECFATTSDCLSTMYCLHDIHKVFQGMCLWWPRLVASQHFQSSQGINTFSSTDKTAFVPAVIQELNITRLWMHECLRIFGDRLPSNEGFQELISLIAKISEKNFGTRLCSEFQTPQADKSSAIRACNLKQQVLSTPFCMEDDKFGTGDVQPELTRQEKRQVLEGNSSFSTSGDALTYSEDTLKKDENVMSEAGVLNTECKSSTEPYPSFPAQKKFTQHVPLPTTCKKINPKMLIQLLQDIASSIHNVIFSPEFHGPLHHFKRNTVYQEKDANVLVHQLLCAIKSKEEKSANGFYIPRMTVHHQNVFQLVHTLKAFLISGGHGALFGATRKTGRKTVVRLAASLLGCQLFEVHPGNEDQIKEILKEIGSHIGVNGRHLAVLVHEDTSQDVKNCLLLMMANGNIPGLYSDQELKNLILKMKTWANTHFQLNDDQALEMYFKTIQTNMHVFLLYPLFLENNETKSAKSAIQKHISKALSLCCCVEVYRPWTSEALVESALHHLKDNYTPKINNAVAKEDSLLASIAQVMAEIHLLATKYAIRHLNIQQFSPQSYIELMNHYLCLCHHLFEQNRVKENQLAKVLANAKDMTDTALRHTQEAMGLKAKCEEKQKGLEELLGFFNSAHKTWEETHHQSLLEEKRLSELEKQSHQLQNQVHDAFKQVSPLFQAAVETLQSLSHFDLDEVRRYRTPPDGVIVVLDVICMLFNHPCGWQNSRQLLMQSSFLKKLECFDCSTLSDDMIKTLGQFVQAPNLQPSYVQDSSRACESLSRWLGAVYQYACVQRRMAPQMARKRDLDQLIAESLARLRVLRLQEMSVHERLKEMEQQLEINRQEMQLLKIQFNTAEEHERESSAALRLMEHHIEDWYSAGKEVYLDRQNIPGDGLILAAAMTYLGPFRPDFRQELLLKWHNLCLTGVETKVPRTLLHDVYLKASTLVPVPVNKEFQIALNQVLGLDLCLIPGDYSDLVRSVVLWGHRVGWVQRWPLLADVHQHELLNSQTSISTGGKTEYHREAKYGLVVSADDPELLDKLNHAAEEGLGVLVTHIERAMANIKILQPFLQTAASVFLSQRGSVKAAHPDFRLFMSTSLPVSALINEIHHSFLDEVQIINLSLSTSEVQELILTELMKSECSELWTLHCHVQAEKLTLQHKLSQNKVSLMEYVMHTSTPLLQDPEFLPLVYTCQSVSLELEKEIKAFSQEFDRCKSLMAEFFRVADLTTALYNALQDVAQLSPCYLFTLHHFLLTLRSALLKRNSDMNVHGPTAVIAEITNRIVSHFISRYKPCLFQSHAALLRLLVSVVLIVHNEGCSEVEQDIFLRGLSKENILSPSTQSVPELPSWIPTHVQSDVYLLETIAPFGGLVSSLISSSKMWQEYLCLPSSTVIGPIPCQSHLHLSTMQRAILWKTLCPHLLAAVEKNLAACAQGHLQRVPTGPPMGYLEELLQLLSQNTGPVVVQLQNQNEDAQMSIHPLYFIQEAALYQADNKGVKVTVISFGSVCHKDAVLSAVLSALDSAIQNGHWLVLNNCHLLDCWDVRIVDELTQLVSCKGHDLETDRLLLNSAGVEKHVHPNFRLWLITKSDKPYSVPAAVRISALHLMYNSSWDLADDLWSSVRQSLSASDTFFSPAHTVRSLLQCAVLHSVLLQRQVYGHIGQGQLYFWSQEDLIAMIDAHDRISKRCSDPAGALEYIAGNLVYGGHVSDLADLAAVQSVVTVCLRQPSASWGCGPHNLVDAISCTGFFDAGSLPKSLSHHIQCITDSPGPIFLGFSPDMADELMKLKSQTLDVLLHQTQSICVYRDIREDPRLLIQPQELPKYKQAWKRLLALQDKLKQKITDIGVEPRAGYLTHLHQFLQAEWECLDKLVLFMILDSIQPVKYNVTNFTPVELTSAALSRLETQADLLGSYLWEKSSNIKPHAYQLSAFLNPQGFLVALIRDIARMQKKDISIFSLHFRVLKETASPSSPSQNGVCLCGLQLQGALWDPGSELLKDSLSPNPSYFPLLWVSVEERTDDESSNTSTLPLYSCPLYVDRQTADGFQHLAADNIIAHVPLSTKLDPVLCTMRRVRLTSTLVQLQQ